MDKIMKAVTFSYDDGVVFDRRLIDIFNRHGMKCSFNLNSAIKEGPETAWTFKETRVSRPDHFDASIYAGHEILFHGSVHAFPTKLSDEELVHEFRDDIEALEKISGEKIVGGAYAYGDYNTHVEDYLRSLGIRYCRTTKQTLDFTPSRDMLAYESTCHHTDPALPELVDRFLELKDPETPQIFYIWGHSYEFEGDHNWDLIEDVCGKLAGRDDILYGTNTEVFRHFGLI